MEVVVIVLKRQTRFGQNVEGLSVPAPCLALSQASLSITINNKSRIDLTDMALAYLPLDEDFWAIPVELKKLKAGKEKSIDLEHLSMRMQRYKLKFHVNGEKHIVENSQITGERNFFQCMGLDYSDNGFDVWEVVNRFDG